MKTLNLADISAGDLLIGPMGVRLRIISWSVYENFDHGSVDVRLEGAIAYDVVESPPETPPPTETPTP